MEVQPYCATQSSSNFLLWMNSLQVSVRSHADESYWELLSFSTIKYAAQGDKLALWSRKLYHLQTWKQTYKLELISTILPFKREKSEDKNITSKK